MDDYVEELSRILAVQFRELMAARAVDSDLEMAYNFQLEEAMAASLALQPSSSTSTLQYPQSPPPISIDDVLKTLELLKFETEIEHRPVSETEKKKMQVELEPNRRIHGIFQMPIQLQAVSNNFQLPYGEGSSSSSKSEDNPEVFKVYFRGLSEEEAYCPSSSIKIKTVIVARIGVVICDSTDEPIFGTTEPLNVTEYDQTSRQSLELQALIVALNTAIDQNLKRIVFYCDYYPLYQFVRGRWQAKQQKIINGLDQVRLLQKRFTYCEPKLIGSKDVNLAFMLARQVINPQIRVILTGERLENCVICLEDKSIDEFFSIEGCTHKYCNSCIKQHVEVKLLHGALPKCPHEGCENDLRFESCEKFLPWKFAKMMRQQMKEDSIPVTEKVYCPYPNCSTLMSKTEARLPRLAYGFAARKCYKCHGNFCISCRVPWHENMSCEEYKRRNPTPIVEESKLKNLAARNLWRQCVKCKHMIELAAGCYHIKCRCGYEFCYTCGAEWKNKKATCSCPLWDEENIIDTEEERDDGVGEEDYDYDDHIFLYDGEYDRYW